MMALLNPWKWKRRFFTFADIGSLWVRLLYEYSIALEDWNRRKYEFCDKNIYGNLEVKSSGKFPVRTMLYMNGMASQTQAPYYWYFVCGIHWWLVDSLQKGPVMQKSFQLSCSHHECLTHCGLVTPYGVRYLSQHWFRYWLVAWWHQAITWTNVHLSLLRSRDIHLRTVSQSIPHLSTTEITLRITYLRFHSNLPGVNELLDISKKNRPYCYGIGLYWFRAICYHAIDSSVNFCIRTWCS